LRELFQRPQVFEGLEKKCSFEWHLKIVALMSLSSLMAFKKYPKQEKQ
jgi:hypothetical protein